MNKVLFALGLLAILAAGTSFAVPPDDADAVETHLEFQGYDVSSNGERMKAMHAENINFFLKKYRGGMLVTAFFGGTEYGKTHREEWFELLNKLNQQAAAARYYVDDEGDMVIEAYYPGAYNKKSFSAFLKAFNLEKSHLADAAPALQKLIK